MSDTLVDRLRTGWFPGGIPGGLLDEAADEIERLRMMLERILSVPEMQEPYNAYIDESAFVRGWNSGLDRAQLEARDALRARCEEAERLLQPDDEEGGSSEWRRDRDAWLAQAGQGERQAAEIERLRAALERIAKTATDVGAELSMTDEEWRDYWSDKCGVHWDIARSALRPGEG